MLILDVEASGTEYHKHSIVSLGALDFDNPENRFYEECRIWDGAHIMDGALEVNGFTEAEITDAQKQSEAELIEKFVAWSESLRDKTLAGQNVSFDRDFVRAACERAGLNYTFAYRTVDSHTLAWMHMVIRGEEPPIDAEHKRSALNLDAVLNYTGIPEEPTPHNALTGALSHAEVISRLLYGKKMLPEFEQYDIPWK
ncbi:MAG: 3'-5' exonuclease [Planctomycetaceae bacterium]|nr:3'-5' exonuclease [Planctomycetaceae bacterium]